MHATFLSAPVSEIFRFQRDDLDQADLLLACSPCLPYTHVRIYASEAITEELDEQRVINCHRWIQKQGRGGLQRD